MTKIVPIDPAVELLAQVDFHREQAELFRKAATQSTEKAVWHDAQADRVNTLGQEVEGKLAQVATLEAQVASRDAELSEERVAAATLRRQVDELKTALANAGSGAPVPSEPVFFAVDLADPERTWHPLVDGTRLTLSSAPKGFQVMAYKTALPKGTQVEFYVDDDEGKLTKTVTEGGFPYSLGGGDYNRAAPLTPGMRTLVAKRFFNQQLVEEHRVVIGVLP